MQEKYFFGPADEDNDGHQQDGYDSASDGSEAGDVDENMFHDYDSEYEVEDFEDDDDEDMYDDEMEEEDFEDEFYVDEEADDQEYEDEEDVSDLRKDIWSNMDWDKD
jgi:hypothetical protein